MRAGLKASVSAAILAATVPPAEGAEPYWLGIEAGRHATGTVEEVWVDEARPELRTLDTIDRRRLTIQIWYPARPGTGGGPAVYAGGIERYVDRTQQLVGAASTRATRSTRASDVESSGAPYPVITYSHGSGWPQFTGTYQTEYLASQGYVVVSIGHSGDDGIARFDEATPFVPDAPGPQLTDEQRSGLRQLEVLELAWDLPEVQRRYAANVEDVSFVLDHLAALNASRASRFYGKLDLERVGALGWSLGGATAFQATLDEPRVRAAVNLDGWMHARTVGIDGAPKPILLIEGVRNSELLPVGEVDPQVEEVNAEVSSRIWKMLYGSTSDWYRATLVETDHAMFADGYLFTAPPEGVIDPLRAHRIINELTLEFFDRYLRDKSASPLLSGERSYPELSIATKRRETQR